MRPFPQQTDDAWVDYHTHVYVPGVASVLTAASAADWPMVLQTCRQHNECAAALGIHPQFCAEWTVDTRRKLQTLLRENGDYVCALGEIGLDFRKGMPPAEEQERCFLEQVDLAVAFGLPVVLHGVKSWDRIACLLEKKGAALQGLCHGFSGSAPQAQRLLKLGLRFSFGRFLLQSPKMQATIRSLPSDAVCFETDNTPEHFIQPDLLLPRLVAWFHGKTFFGKKEDVQRNRGAIEGAFRMTCSVGVYCDPRRCRGRALRRVSHGNLGGRRAP